MAFPDHDYFDFYNKHAGETCLLVATGPSLEDVPLNFLEWYTTFSMNRITLMAPKFVPDYYLCIGLTHFDTPEKRDTIMPILWDERCRAAFLSRFWDFWYPYTKVFTTCGAMELYGVPVGFGGFSLAPFTCVGTTTNSTYPSLQFIYYMGFTRVLIVGLDHRYPDGPKKHFYSDDEAPGFDIGPAHNTHEVWQDYGNKSFELAKEVFERDGREIINLTPDSAETVFVKDELENWV